MEPWPEIPDDVVNWFRDIFSNANKRVCERLMNLPNIRETSLDDGLIEALIPESAPTLLRSGAIVRMDTHNIGGLRRLGGPPWDWDRPFRGRWETADIAILVFVYRGDTLVAKKIGLLQSKRLYPDNNDVDDEDEAGFRFGMNAFLGRDGHQAVGALHRTFSFTDDSIYGAIHAGDNQIQLIDQLNRDFGKAVYYLLYNPDSVPCSVTYPLRQRIKVTNAEAGCRVLDADQVHAVLAGLGQGKSPSYASLAGANVTNNWPLETWAADLLLTCKVGERFTDDREERVHYFLQRRSGPIGAALAASITLPE